MDDVERPVAAEGSIASTATAFHPGWFLTAFLIYFLLIASVIMLFILIAWRNGS
ncbi:MAG: hypothetical protein R2839_05860 [Thermomicrobiales bacterium]